MIYLILTYIFSPLIYAFIFFRNIRKKVISNILLVQTAKIGDMVCSTHVFHVIKTAYPNVTLTVLCNPITYKLIRFDPNIDKFQIVRSTKGIRNKINLIKKLIGKYDVSINLVPNVPFTLILFWSLIPIRIGLRSKASGLTYRFSSALNTHNEYHSQGQMVSATYLRALYKLGIKTNDITRYLYSSPDATDKVEAFFKKWGISSQDLLIGLACGSGNPLKRLPNIELIKMIQLLLEIENTVKTIIIGDKNDLILIAPIFDFFKDNNRVINACGKFELYELIALFKRLNFFIGSDTGNIYIADVAKIPLILLAGPNDPSYQRPIGEKSIVMNSEKCIPCMNPFKVPYFCQRKMKSCIRLSVPYNLNILIRNNLIQNAN